MKAIFIVCLLLALVLPASALPTISAPALTDLQHTDPQVFGLPYFVINMSLDKGDSVVGYALIGGGQLEYQNVTDLIGLPASTKGWLDKLPEPIGG